MRHLSNILWLGLKELRVLGAIQSSWSCSPIPSP